MKRNLRRPDKWMRTAYFLLFFLMALTGFGQMPIFKRYYIADIPGLGWLADFYATHFLHYLGAALLMALCGYVVVGWFIAWRKEYALTRTALLRIALLAAIIVTGVFRMAKNLPDVVFSPGFTMFIDISHLVFMMLLLVVHLTLVILKKKWVSEPLRISNR